MLGRRRRTELIFHVASFTIFDMDASLRGMTGFASVNRLLAALAAAIITQSKEARVNPLIIAKVRQDNPCPPAKA